IPNILRPAIPLIPGSNARYHGYIFEKGEWVDGQKIKENYIFEWALIKSDQYGNPLAIKKLEPGVYVDVIIPEDYKSYRLMLTAINRRTGISASDTSILHTPAVSGISEESK